MDPIHPIAPPPQPLPPVTPAPTAGRIDRDTPRAEQGPERRRRRRPAPERHSGHREDPAPDADGGVHIDVTA